MNDSITIDGTPIDEVDLPSDTPLEIQFSGHHPPEKWTLPEAGRLAHIDGHGLGLIGDSGEVYVFAYPCGFIRKSRAWLHGHQWTDAELNMLKERE